MLGLGAAKLLAQAGHRVTVFEAADHVGGLADPWTVGDLTWDRHYHVISPADETLLRLIDDIGLAKSVHWSPDPDRRLRRRQALSGDDHHGAAPLSPAPASLTSSAWPSPSWWPPGSRTPVRSKTFRFRIG